MLQAYVPRFVGRFDGVTSPSGGVHRYQQRGTVLITDISGFSASAAQLSASARDGAEETQRLLNSLFGPSVRALLAAGGDIVCFAGDAIVVWWPSPYSADLAWRAAVNLHRSLADNPAAEASGLRVRTAIATGDYWAANPGGSQRSFPLLGGAGFATLARLLEELPPQEIGCCPVTAQERALEQAPVGYVPEAAGDELSDRRLERFVSSNLRWAQSMRQSDWLAELRQISVVFIAPELSIVDAAAPDALQVFVSTINECAGATGGTINQVAIDDKGLIGLAVFGVAGHVHEDDAYRSIDFATRTHARLQAAGIESRIGVARGRVFCGLRGAKERADFAVIGHCVNLAARLMSVAEGIAVDEQTRTDTLDKRLFMELQGRRLKNMPAGTRVFVPETQAAPGLNEPSTEPSTAFQGRESEIAHFERLVSQLEHGGSGGSVVVRGAAGIGKSALLREFDVRLQAHGVKVLRGKADSMATTTPYYSWRTLLRLLFTESEACDPSALKKALARMVPTELASSLALLNPMLPVPLIESASTRLLGAEARLSATKDLLVALLQQLADGSPVALVFEDAHWIDDLSRGALLAVTSSISGVLTVLSTRPASGELEVSGEARIDDALVAQGATLFDLGELSIEDARGLLCSELRVQRIPNELASLVFERTGGHPLFVQQLAGSLSVHPAVEVTDDEVRLQRHATLDDLVLPESIAAVVTATLDRLDLEQQIVLKLIAVVGRAVTDEEFEVLLPDALSARRPWQTIDPEVAVQLLTTSNSGLAFRHALIRRSIYEVMTEQQRTSLHLQVVQYLESMVDARGGDRHAQDLLAYHNERAGRIVRAIDLLEDSGKQAVFNDIAPVDAIQTLTHLLELEAAHPQAGAVGIDRMRLPGQLGQQSLHTRRAHWHRLLGEAYAKVGETGASLMHLTSAVTELGLSLPIPRHRLVRAFGLSLTRRLAVAPGPVRGDSLTDRERRSLIELVAAHDRFSRLCYTQGQEAQGVASALFATSLAERLGPSSELCNAYSMMANVVAAFGRFDIGRAYIRRAAEASAVLQDPAMEALTSSLPYFWTTTLWDRQTLRPMQRAVGLFDSLGDHQAAALSTGFVARLYMLAGEYDRCELELEAMTQRAKRGDARHLLIRAEINQAELAIRRGNRSEAKTLAAKAAHSHFEFGEIDQTIRFQLEGVQSWLALREGRRGAAGEHADAALTALQKGGAGSFYPHLGFAGIFDVFLDKLSRSPEDSKSLIRWYSPAIKTLRSQQRTRPYVRPQYYLYDGRLKQLLGQTRAAERALRRGRLSAAALEGPWEISLFEREVLE